MTLLTRRRFLTISAACAAVPAMAGTSAQWRGIALGAPASLRLEGLSDEHAAPIFAAVEEELNRLENIFSLYRPASELSRLNRDGTLTAPAPELLSVLSLCSALHDASGGAFDPSIQPVWAALARRASMADIAVARGTVGWRKVSFDAGEVRLPQPRLSALTLNGIAQGAITDRIAALLRSFGLRNVLVNMGEIAALGQRGGGDGWRVGLLDADGAVDKRIKLQDRAVATSAPAGTMLGQQQGHILSPGSQSVLHSAVSVSAPEAAVADGLSTALCLVPRPQIDDVLNHFSDARLEMLA